MKVTILVPFFNEEEMIVKTHQAIKTAIQPLSKYQFELMYIDDGSTDRTLDLMREIANQDSLVHYLSFSRNFGKEAGMLAGLEHSRGDCVIIMDGDLQNPPRLIQAMLDKFEEGYDIVNAKRTRNGDKKMTRFFAHTFYQVANRIMDVQLTDGISDFRLLSKQAVDAIVSLQEYNRFSKGLFSWIGFKEAVIDYPNEQREAGSTKWSFKKSLNYGLDGILSFSNKPLRMIFILGLTCIALAVLYLLWLFINYIRYPDLAVSGYFTTIFIVVLFGGVQLVSIGVLGEYIGKIFYEVKKRPHYLIKESNLKERRES